METFTYGRKNDKSKENMKRYNDFIAEANSNLMVYKNRNTGEYYNYSVLKGDKLYQVRFKRGVPFSYKYVGRVNRGYHNINGQIVKNPSMALISLIQKKIGDRVNEEFEEVNNIPPPDKLSFFNKVKEKVSKAVKGKSKSFKVSLDPGRGVMISTGNDKDIKIQVIVEEDNRLQFNVVPTEGPEYSFVLNYADSEDMVDTVVGMIEDAIDADPNGGITKKRRTTSKKLASETATKKEEPKKAESEKDINKPIRKRPSRKIKSIDIDVINNVLEDAYILDDIDLKNTSVEELLRRMLIEMLNRKKK